MKNKIFKKEGKKNQLKGISETYKEALKNEDPNLSRK
jgi:hypothetical protein